jgi:hypothetical protein
MRTCIIVVITLTSDKLSVVKEGFCIRDYVHQGHEWSTPRQIEHHGGLHPLERRSKVMPTYTIRWDGTTPIRGLCTLACQLRFIGWHGWCARPSTSRPHMRKLSSQAKQIKMAAPYNTRTIRTRYLALVTPIFIQYQPVGRRAFTTMKGPGLG